MTEGVWIGLLGVVGTLVTTLGGIAVAAINRRLKTVTEHVQNSHVDPTTGKAYNLRDNIDDNQRVLTDAVARLEASIGYVASDVKGLRRDIGRLDQRDIEDAAELRETRKQVNQRIDNLERTINPKEKP